jgi:hypothetical protein
MEGRGGGEAQGVADPPKKEIVGATLEEACRKNGANFSQLIFSLFCVAKRGFVEPCKNVSR